MSPSRTCEYTHTHTSGATRLFDSIPVMSVHTFSALGKLLKVRGSKSVDVGRLCPQHLPCQPLDEVLESPGDTKFGVRKWDGHGETCVCCSGTGGKALVYVCVDTLVKL